MAKKNAGIIGIGAYLPDKILTNADLEKIVDTSDEWIVSRSGIRKRHVANANEATSDLAAHAASKAIQDAQLSPRDIDMIIIATITPDMMMPSTATRVQGKIKATNACAFDIGAACSGFVYGLTIAKNFILNGTMRNVVVIGAEILTKYVDWNDRTTCVLFGDGAGAVVVSTVNAGRGLLGFHLGADGNTPMKWLMLPGSGSFNGSVPVSEDRKDFITMDGKAIFKFGVSILPNIINKALIQSHLTINDIKLIVPHQANIRIIEAAAKRLGVGMDKFYVNLDQRANTSAASIPIAMFDARNEGKLQNGDAIVLGGFGGGLTWASIALVL
ncbi:3-oxoacyl-[acyl-carrier-protein] synthase 3 [subsurface metagenome]